MDKISDLLHRGKKEQVLSSYETARAVREVTLNAMFYGVHGSKSRFGNENHRGVNLPGLLGYTEKTRRLFEGIRTSLSVPEENIFGFAINDGKAEVYKEEGDVIYVKNNGVHEFRFDTGIFQPGVAESDASPTILGIDGYSDGSWELIFGQSRTSPTDRILRRHLSDEVRLQRSQYDIGVKAEACRPDRQLLLNFLLVPEGVRVEDALKENGFVGKIGRYVKVEGSRKVDEYEVYELSFDAKGFKKHISQQPGFSRTIIMGADKWDPNKRFQAVVVGKVDIGNLTYSVVTGAERPLVKEQVKVGESKPVGKPILAPIRVRPD